MTNRQTESTKTAQPRPTWWQGLTRLALMAGRGAGTTPLMGRAER